MSCTKRSSDFVGKSYRDHNVNREVGECRSDDRTQLKNYELSLHSFTHRVNDGVLKGVSNIWVWGVTIQIKALLQYFHMVLFIWYVFLTFESVDEILWCYHLNETSSAVLSHGTIYLVCISNFWVRGWNPMVLPFKWNLFSSTLTWYYLFSMYCSCNFWVCGPNPLVWLFIWNLLGSTFTWYYFLFSIQQKEIWIFLSNFHFGHFWNKRVLTSHAVSSHLKTMAPTTQSSSLALQFESDRASHLNILQLTTDPN